MIIFYKSTQEDNDISKFIGKQIIETNRKCFEQFATELRELNGKKESTFDSKSSSTPSEE